MRHRKKRFQLNRFTSWRKATLKSLSRNLFIHQSIRTSRQKAKAVRPLVEKIIGLAKQNTLYARRQAFAILGDHKLVSLIFNEIGPRFANRQSGFIRIINLDTRRGDNAQSAILELTEIKKKELKKVKKEIKPEAEKGPEIAKEKPIAETRPQTAEKVKPPIVKKPAKKFFGGLRKIFKKERDSL